VAFGAVTLLHGHKPTRRHDAGAERCDVRLRRQFAVQHWQQSDRALAASELVAKPCAGSEHRRPGGQHVHVGEMVGGDLEERRWVGKTMDLVQHDPPAAMAPQKRLRIVGIPANARQVAVEVVDVGTRAGERRLAETARAREPHDPPLPPFLFDPAPPQRPIDGVGTLFHALCSSQGGSVWNYQTQTGFPPESLFTRDLSHGSHGRPELHGGIVGHDGRYILMA
jgi:hypothetical protein